MRQPLLLGGLPLQRNECFRVLFEVALEQLDGDEGISVPGLFLEHVLALPHRAHAALAELGQKLEAVPQVITFSERPGNTRVVRIPDGGPVGAGVRVLGFLR